MSKTRVVNRRNKSFDIYIGRPSKWGNLFKIGRGSTRGQVINRYRKWILKQPKLLLALKELEGKVLGCWCKPLPCHGDVLVELIEGRKENGREAQKKGQDNPVRSRRHAINKNR